MIFDFSKKNILITGSNSGNGLAIANAFIKLKANVIRIDKKFTNKIKSYDIVFDLENYSKIKKLKENIKLKFKKIDVIINNAGISIPSNNSYKNFDLYHRTLAVNLHSPFYIISYISEIMPKNSAVIQITSLGSKFGFKNNPSYQISKAGLAQLAKCAAIDFQKKKIRFNNICPGYIKTNMTIQSFKNKKKSKERIERSIIKRWGVPNDLVGAVIFLSSNYSSYINGSTIDIDGGWSINSAL